MTSILTLILANINFDRNHYDISLTISNVCLAEYKTSLTTPGPVQTVRATGHTSAKVKTQYPDYLLVADQSGKGYRLNPNNHRVRKFYWRPHCNYWSTEYDRKLVYWMCDEGDMGVGKLISNRIVYQKTVPTPGQLTLRWFVVDSSFGAIFASDFTRRCKIYRISWKRQKFGKVSLLGSSKKKHERSTADKQKRHLYWGDVHLHRINYDGSGKKSFMKIRIVHFAIDFRANHNPIMFGCKKSQFTTMELSQKPTVLTQIVMRGVNCERLFVIAGSAYFRNHNQRGLTLVRDEKKREVKWRKQIPIDDIIFVTPLC
ncbi:uncharacterized protein LOC124152576 [Haliotis rufescens]|uniref:uncharacterized protein LOC124152576 n=1 Tax=Haliotis rufescens TaxID=6454 RepID=UPI00201F5B38|nr:uncharacterized protein LOC124152576 [Haliotis rufescens]